MEVGADEVSENFAVVMSARTFGAWNSHEPDRLVGLTDPSVEWEDPGIDGGRLTGQPALRAWLERTWACWPDLTFEPTSALHLAMDHRSVMVAWRATGAMLGAWSGYAPTHRAVEFSGVDMHRYRGGKIVCVATVYDMLPISRAIGALPPEGSLLERAGAALQHLTAWGMRRRKGRIRLPANRTGT